MHSREMGITHRFPPLREGDGSLYLHLGQREGATVTTFASDAVEEWTSTMERAQTRAARHYVLERCRKKTYIECAEVARLTGWPDPQVRRFIAEVQDEWRQIQGIRPRGRPRKRF